MKMLVTAVSLCAVLLSAGCTTPTTGSGPEPGTAGEPPVGAALSRSNPVDDRLFQALGGHAGIEALSESFVRELAADEVTRAFFTRTDITRFHRLIQEQLCVESGGGCAYTGEDMRTAHAGLGIERRHMNAVVEALMRAMDKEQLPMSTQNAVLALHAPKRADVLDE